MSDTKTLTKLGSQKTKYKTNKVDTNLLETFENQHPKNDYVIPFECFEFSSLCPKTGQPDMSTIYLTYIPNKKCVESKSLKLYLFSFRQTGEFMEDLTNRIMKDMIKLLDPKYIEVFSDFNSRGGIYLRPYCNYYQQGVDKDYINNLLNRYAVWKQNKVS
jgi:7-cyano-7-deazaguanine reductase